MGTQTILWGLDRELRIPRSSCNPRLTAAVRRAANRRCFSVKGKSKILAGWNGHRPLSVWRKQSFVFVRRQSAGDQSEHVGKQLAPYFVLRFVRCESCARSRLNPSGEHFVFHICARSRKMSTKCSTSKHFSIA